MLERKYTVKSLFVVLAASLFAFMFRNSDPYFNINNYKGILFLAVAIGLVQVIAGFTKLRHGKIVMSFILLFIGYMLFAKFVLGLPDEPYYILYISILYLFLLCMAVLDFDKGQLQFLIKSYIVSSTIMGVLILIQHKAPYSGLDMSRLALYYSGEKFYDVNFTAMYMIMPTLFSYKLGIESRNQSQRRLYIIFTAINIIAILMLGSRGAFAPVLAIIAFDFLTDKQVSIGKVLLLVGGIFAIFFLVPDDIYARLLGEKYFNPESKRIVDWMFGIDVFKQSPWVGNGMIPPRTLVTQIAGVNWYTIHNTYIVYLAQLGIVGCIPALAIFLYPMKKLWNGVKKSFLFLSYCGLLFAALMIESNYTYVLIVPLSMFYALMHFSDRSGSKDVLEAVLDLKA